MFSYVFPYQMAPCDSLRRLLMMVVSLLMLTHATPVLAVLPPSAAWVMNKGSDNVITYAIGTADGTLTPLGQATAGGNPVDLAYHPNGVWAYGLNNTSLNLSMYRIDPTTHLLTEVGRVGAGIDPHSVRVHPRGHTLYATSHGFAKELPNVAYNALWWYTLDAFTGVPRLVNEISTGGTDPAEFAIDPTGRYLVLANYLSDTLSVFRLDQNTGAPTFLRTVPAGDRPQASDGPLSVAFDPSGKRMYASMYYARELWMYRFEANTGVLTMATKVPTAGFPTMVRVHASNQYLFVVQDGAQAPYVGAVGTYTLDAAGKPTWVSTVPTGGKTTEAIALDRTGRFAYVANQRAVDGYNVGNIAEYAIDVATGRLTPIGLGNVTTRGFPTTVVTSNPVADQARQDLLTRATTDPRFGAPLLGTFAEDLTDQIFGVPGFEVRWLVFQVTGNRFGIIFQATSTADLSQHWTNIFDPDKGVLTGWVPAF